MKIGNLLAKITKKKQKTQMKLKMKGNSLQWMLHNKELWDCYMQVDAHKLDNLEEMNKFLKRYNKTRSDDEKNS